MQNSFLIEMGNRISAQRKSKGMTQEQLAEKMDVSIQMISNLELGKKAIRPENLVKLCTVLNVSSDYLLTGKISLSECSGLSDKISHLSETEISLLESLVSYMYQK